MKNWWLLTLFICCHLHSFEFIQNQQLPTTITYNCTNIELEDSFTRMFSIWNLACDNIFTIKKVDTDATISIRYSVLQPLIGGNTSDFGASALILIQYTLFSDSIMLHEIGHALGLDHTDTLHSIMNPWVKRDATLIQDDIDGVRELYNLSPKVFDFVLRVKDRGFRATCTYGFADWSTLNFTLIKHRKTIRMRQVGGQVEMIFNGIAVYKDVK